MWECLDKSKGVAILQEYIYAGSTLLATVAGGTVTYHHPDQLSNRLETNSSGGQTRTFGHLPFGDAWYETGTTDKWKFTTYERDLESALDYAVYRSYTSRLGRFMTADPYGGSGRADDPQTWNRYAYVLNRPRTFRDPLGLDDEPITIYYACVGDQCAAVSFQDITVTAGGFLGVIGGGGHEWAPLLDWRLPEGGGGPNNSNSGATSGGEQDPTANREVLRIMFCLWARGGYGWQRTERSDWITRDSAGNYREVPWPWSATRDEETWAEPIPATTVLLAHTHGDRAGVSPRPSTTGGNTGRGDQGTSDKLASIFAAQDRPESFAGVYVVTGNAIWKAVPNQKEPVQVQGNGWTKGFDQKKDCKR